jgi:hypothetical protein
MSLLDRLKAWRADRRAHELEELDEERRGDLKHADEPSDRIIRARSPRGTRVLADDDYEPPR